MSDGLGGPVYSPVSWFRDDDCLVFFDAVEGMVCPVCGSGEVRYPLQPAVPPAILDCLKCGKSASEEEFA